MVYVALNIKISVIILYQKPEFQILDVAFLLLQSVLLGG